MTKKNWRVALLVGGLVALCALLLRPQHPPEKLPASAKNIRYSASSSWQYWNYCLRFDADPRTCHDFAIQLMVQHGGRREDITEKPVQTFDLGNMSPSWMKIEPLTNGILISCNNGWINAVVDQDRGRLYYRGFN